MFVTNTPSAVNGIGVADGDTGIRIPPTFLFYGKEGRGGEASYPHF